MYKDETTLVIHWVFSCLAILVMLVRLVWKRATRQSFNMGDYLTMAAIVCALTRLGLIHVVLTWGTTNMPRRFRAKHKFTDQEIYRREIGSQLSIANRFFYNSYLWLQKLVLLDVYRRLLLDLPYEKLIIRSFLFVFFGSYIAIQVVTFSECRPFHLYWQVLPDPGLCAKAQVQLITVGILNIVTDFMLLILPIPVVASMKAPWRRKAQLYTLFTLGLFIISITIIRLPINSKHKDSQINRTTWASTELLTSALVVNAPTLYGLWNKRRKDRSAASSKGKGYPNQGSSGPDAYNETIGGSNESYLMSPKRKPTGGLSQAKEAMVSELRDIDRRLSRDYVQLPEDPETASRHSSRREILKY